MDNVDDEIYEELQQGSRGGKGFYITFSDETSAAEIKRVISELSSAGWICKAVSGKTIYLTTSAALS